MNGPLVLGSIGSAIIAVAAVLNIVLITPRRYDLDGVGFNGEQPELRRMVVDQGRIGSVGLLGAAFQLVAIVWQAAR